ncbi:MAG: hypothetical protein G01um101429_959 [Parcubacteria group bacterium Gr01-1014_29]|nr:MAG: hypothetical protein G01um101429_959 [Parcubacteria group bacterium Gr01-1014_29]
MEAARDCDEAFSNARKCFATASYTRTGWTEWSESRSRMDASRDVCILVVDPVRSTVCWGNVGMRIGYASVTAEGSMRRDFFHCWNPLCETVSSCVPGSRFCMNVFPVINDVVRMMDPTIT